MDWGRISSAYEGAVDKLSGVTEKGNARVAANRLQGIWYRFTDFLMADFPARATFMAGFVLGLRMG